MGLLARPLTERLAERAERSGILTPDGRYVPLRSPTSAFAAYRWTNDYENKVRRLYNIVQSHRSLSLDTTKRDLPPSLLRQYDLLMLQLLQCRANVMIATADLYDAHRLDIWNDIPSGETRLSGGADIGGAGRIGDYWRTTDQWRSVARAELAEIDREMRKLPPSPKGVLEQDFTETLRGDEDGATDKGMGFLPAIAALPVGWQATIYIVGLVAGAAVIGAVAMYGLRGLFTFLGINSPAYDAALDAAQEAFEQALADCDSITDAAARAQCRMDVSRQHTGILEDVQENMEPRGNPLNFAMLAAAGIGALILLRPGD